ncbi:MAG: hypothetical protein IJY25_04195 [Bacilli bacterium]|nr:hypothetical protein [Bacilli bacterium]
MSFFKKKNKTYYVTLITKDKKESMYVTGKSKKEVKEMVSSVVINCSLFPFRSKEDFKIKVKSAKFKK